MQAIRTPAQSERTVELLLPLVVKNVNCDKLRRNGSPLGQESRCTVLRSGAFWTDNRRWPGLRILHVYYKTRFSALTKITFDIGIKLYVSVTRKSRRNVYDVQKHFHCTLHIVTKGGLQSALETRAHHG